MYPKTNTTKGRICMSSYFIFVYLILLQKNGLKFDYGVLYKWEGKFSHVIDRVKKCYLNLLYHS